MKKIPDQNVILHLRYATRGAKTIENCHPFEVNNGYMAHNGTIYGMGSVSTCATTGCNESDTSELATMLKNTTYKRVSDVQPLLQHIVGTNLNKLVFMENTGKVTIINDNLGIRENGVWYSNDYHVPPPNLTKVFVYGTLKKGHYNHYLLGASTYLGKASTVAPHIMIGESYTFPYVLGKASQFPGKQGHLIQGEVYEVEDHVLVQLDRLEGYPKHYDKVDTLVTLPLGKPTLVKMYIKAKVTQYDLGETPLKVWAPKKQLTTAKEVADAVTFITEADKLSFYEVKVMRTFDIEILRLLLKDYSALFYGFARTYKHLTTKDQLIAEADSLAELILEEYDDSMSVIGQSTIG